MKRNMDLVRQILLALEAHEDPAGMANVEIDGQQQAEVNCHLTIMVEAGLIYGQEYSHEAVDDTIWMYVRMTWRGHDVLDAARDDARWAKVKAQLEATGGAWTLAILEQLLAGGLRADLGLAEG